MEHWGIWDWTKFICCNHRPIESGDRVIGYQQSKNVNGQDFQDTVVNSQAHYHNNYQYYYADNTVGYIPINVETNNPNIMDGLRVQLQKRKGVSLRSPPVRRSDESTVTLRGWLYRLEGAALKQWKRRWCVLADYCLFYYKDMEEEKLLGSLLLPSYKITPCLSEDGIARKFAFKAEHNNMKTYYFAADSKESQTQWMNSLSLASIMQLSSAFSNVRNQGDGQEVANNEDEEEESGFTSYQSRRRNSGAMSTTYDANIGSGDKYPGSYNSVGLPIVYQQNMQRPIQRSHYVNAPPKPKRQYYDNSDLYVIPPSAQYHNHNHATPDLIAHDSYNSNYLPPNYYTQSYPYDQSSAPYRLPPPGQTRFARLPPRPHSADFLERDQEDEEDDEEYPKMITPNAYNASSRPDNYYPSSPSSEPPKIMPVRPKSSLERYDPYSRYYLEQSGYGSAHYPNSSTKEPRPWSDYLVTANNINSPQNDNQSHNTTFPPLSSSHLPHYHSSNANYQLDGETPRNYQREESLQRLLEWKQRMLQSPLNKRNWSQQQQMQPQSTKAELPSRPPLPEEYRTKFTIKDALKGPQYTQRERSKSSGDGSEFVNLNSDDLHSPQKNAPVNYSSDDEAELNLQLPYTQRLNETSGRTTPDYINISSFVKDKDSDLDMSKEDYYKASTMFYQRFSQSGRESTLMSPISFHSESNHSKASESLEQSFTKQDWGDVGLPVPDQASLARTVSRRSLKRVNTPSIAQQKDPIDNLKTDIKLEKREDGDGVDEQSVKSLFKKFSENESSKLNLIQSANQSFSGDVSIDKGNYVLKSETSKPLQNSNFYLKSYLSDSEILDSNSTADDETNTTRSAPIMLSPLSCVLADLRKTADVRKEKLYSLSRSQSSTTKLKVDEIIVTKGALQLIDNNKTTSNDGPVAEQSEYLNMEKTVKDEDEYVAMDGEELEKESDAADDADDEASRDFDTLNYRSEVINENDIKLKAGCKVRTYKKPRPEPVPTIANTYQHLSHIAKELLNPNPAYETFDEIRTDTEAKSVSVEPNNDNSDKQRSPNAPYYYSDLLSEEQQIALQERLAACQSGSPPPLLSRCNALNNTRFLGTTSLQKTDIGKRVNNIINSINKNDSSVSLNNAVVLQTDIESSLKSMLLPNVSKFLDSERNKYEAGHTLEKVPEGDKSFSYMKRCMTPDINQFKTRTDLEFQSNDSLLENAISSRRRSKSLEGLVDQQNRHIYENLEQQSFNENDNYGYDSENGNNDYSDDELMGTEVLRRVSKRHFAENFNAITSPITSPINQNKVPLVEKVGKSLDDFTETESELSSLIELSIDSVSGPIMAEKVRKRRSSHKRRSKDDLNASDSEIQKSSTITKPMHVKPKSLKDAKSARLCVSTGDLLGKSHEELVLLLIQLRRTQSQLAKNCDQLRLQMESEEKMIEIEPHKREEHKVKYRELRERLSQYEKQYEMQFPLINTVDNMIKLNNPQTNEDFMDNRAKAASTSILDQVSLEEETNHLSALQQDKEILERTLEGVKNKVAKIGTESGPVVNLEKLKKQQRMIEGELNRVRGLLTHSAKRLEEKAAENAQMEQDVLIAKNKLKQVLANEHDALESNRTSSLEAELAHINQVIDDLHNRRVELNNAIENLKVTDKKREVVRASPTGLAGSIPLPGKKRLTTTYMETDLDSMDTRDLAHCPRNSGSESEDTPLYENLETNNSVNNNDIFMCQFQPNDDLLSGNTEDIIDEQMKQFYGIIPAPQKANEIKTVRIVKRESERRRIHFANGSIKSSDSYWSQDNDYTGGAVGGIGSIPPPYYYEDREEEENNMFNSTNDCIDETHCIIDRLNAEFQRTNLVQNNGIQNIYSNEKQLQQQLQQPQPQQQQQLFSTPERTRSASVSLPSTSSNSSLPSSPFSFRLTHVRRLESKYGRLSTTRRHHTISSSQPQLFKNSNSVSTMWRSCDDTDMELRYRNSLNTPDIVKSTIKKSEDFDEKLIEREIMLPKKIDIPERYIPDDEPEEISASEKLKRSMKAEMIRRMLSESTTYEDVRRDNQQQIISSSSSSSAIGDENGLSEETRIKLNEEKKRRAQLLALNHELAKEVMERSRIVAANNDNSNP